jgi:hypothetical protein
MGPNVTPPPPSSAVTPEPPSSSTNGTAKRKFSLHAFQVRAFLNAAEDVETDAETVADILEGTQDTEVEEVGAGLENFDSKHEDEAEELDISALFELEKGGE